jgi:hypothetical protein
MLCILAALLAFSRSATASDLEVWQVSPYRIQILTAIENSPVLVPGVQKQLLENILYRIENVVGAPWDTYIDPAPDALRRQMLYSLDDLTIEQAAKLVETWKNPDKIMFLTIRAENGAWKASVREYDARTLQLGPPSISTAWQLGKLRDAATDAILNSFSPLADIETVNCKERKAVLHLKAAGLPSRDPSLKVMQPGMIFRPYIRMNSLYGNKPPRVTPVQWTFLSVDKAAPERLDCRIESGMATPLNDKRRPRMEQLALAVHPAKTPSEVILKSRTDPKDPLPGYLIYEFEKDSKDAAILVGKTDWQGKVTIAPTGKVLRFLAIKNGQEMLGRLPVVPGLEPSILVEIRNDDFRLQAEGFVIGLQEELIDIFAHREMYRKRSLARLEEGEVEQAQALFDDLVKLPNNRAFSLKLGDEKKRLPSKDIAVQGKIDKLFKETQDLVDKFLEEKPIAELTQELSDAKRGVKKEQ